MAHAAESETAKLVYMANQIAAFFHAYPETTAVEGVRTHLKSFWTPRMLRDLANHASDTNLDRLVAAALPGLLGA